MLFELNLSIKMRAPVDQEHLFADLREHIAPLIEQGYHSGEMLICDKDEKEVRGWWELTTT
jgi:hypothetical protein